MSFLRQAFLSLALLTVCQGQLADSALAFEVHSHRPVVLLVVFLVLECSLLCILHGKLAMFVESNWNHSTGQMTF